MCLSHIHSLVESVSLCDYIIYWPGDQGGKQLVKEEIEVQREGGGEEKRKKKTAAAGGKASGEQCRNLLSSWVKANRKHIPWLHS